MLPPGVVSRQEGAGGSLPFSRDLCRCYQLQERHGTALGSQVRAVKLEILVFQKQTLAVKKSDGHLTFVRGMYLSRTP